MLIENELINKDYENLIQKTIFKNTYKRLAEEIFSEWKTQYHVDYIPIAGSILYDIYEHFFIAKNHALQDYPFKKNETGYERGKRVGFWQGFLQGQLSVAWYWTYIAPNHPNYKKMIWLASLFQEVHASESLRKNIQIRYEYQINEVKRKDMLLKMCMENPSHLSMSSKKIEPLNETDIDKYTFQILGKELDQCEDHNKKFDSKIIDKISFEDIEKFLKDEKK